MQEGGVQVLDARKLGRAGQAKLMDRVLAGGGKDNMPLLRKMRERLCRWGGGWGGVAGCWAFGVGCGAGCGEVGCCWMLLGAAVARGLGDYLMGWGVKWC